MNHNNRSGRAARDHGPRLEKWATIGGFYHSDIGRISAQLVWRIGQELLGTVLEWSYMHTKDSYAVVILQGYSPPSRIAGTNPHTLSKIRSSSQKKTVCARKEPGTTRREEGRDESHTQLSRKLGGCTVLLQYPSLQLGFGWLVWPVCLLHITGPCPPHRKLIGIHVAWRNIDIV